jgi:DNA-binding winged helix-turn-helix (wHTH) protein
VHRGDTEITLTPREFGVLEHLMRRAGEVVTKTDILRAVWDAHYEGEVNVVEVYVGYLRRKIDAPFGTSSIETLRGVGYRMADPTPPDRDRHDRRRAAAQGSAASPEPAPPATGAGRPGRDRQAHAEQRPAQRAADDVHRAAVRRDHLRDDRQPQPGTAVRARPGVVEADEPLEHRAPAGRAARPARRPATSSAAYSPERPHRDHHRRAGVPAGVVDEVAHHLRELPPVADHPHVRGLDPRDDPAGGRSRSASATSSRSTSSNRGRRPLSSARASSSSASTSRPSRAVSPRRAVTVSRSASPARQQLQAGRDRRQRAAQLVAGVRDEPALHGLARLQPGEHLVHRLGQPPDLVAGRGTGTRTDGSRVVATRARMASTGRRAPPRREVGDDPGDQHQQRDPDSTRWKTVSTASCTVLQRLCGVDDEVAPLHRRRRTRRPDLLGRSRDRPARSRRGGHPLAAVDLAAPGRACSDGIGPPTTGGSTRR